MKFSPGYQIKPTCHNNRISRSDQRRPTLARVKATLILCQSPSSEDEQFLGFRDDLTNDNITHSLSLP